MSEPTAKENLREAISAFRLGIDAQGSAALVKFIDHLSRNMQENVSLFGEAESNVLTNIVEAQSRSDFIYVADLLEYVLPNTNLVNCY